MILIIRVRVYLRDRPCSEDLILTPSHQTRLSESRIQATYQEISIYLLNTSQTRCIQYFENLAGKKVLQFAKVRRAESRYYRNTLWVKRLSENIGATYLDPNLATPL